MEVNANKEEPWKSMGMTHKVQVHSNYTTQKHYLFFVFIVLFMRLLIYISTDWIFATAVNTLLFNSVWVYTFFSLICSLSSLQFHFVLLWLFFHPFFSSRAPHSLVQMQFLWKKCFCMKRNQKFCNDFYQLKMHHKECHPWHRGGTPCQFFQDAFLDSRQSCHTHTHKHTYTHTRECTVHPFSMEQIHTT